MSCSTNADAQISSAVAINFMQEFVAKMHKTAEMKGQLFVRKTVTALKTT
jgi:hypothetical protein